MHVYQLSIWSKEQEIARETLIFEKPVEERQLKENVARVVNELVRDEFLDPVGEVDWALSEVKDIDSGKHKY